MPVDDLDALRACRRACLAAVRHTLDADGPRLDDAQISLLLDGAELCERGIRFRRRNSTLHPRLCAVCVEVCERCVQLCEAFSPDAVMRACADACRQCADVCRRLAGDPSAGDPRVGGAPGSGSGQVTGAQGADDVEARRGRA